MNINVNTKFIIMAVLFLFCCVGAFYLQNLKQNEEENYKEYEKTANEIAIIKQLKSYYGDNKSNKRKIYNIINSYNSRILMQKEDKSSLEFTITKLKYNELDNLNKEILNSGVKVNKLSIKRLTHNSGELFCKVLF